jgi:hypothetical protein
MPRKQRLHVGLHRLRVRITSVARECERDIHHGRDVSGHVRRDGCERRRGTRRHGHQQLGLALLVVNASTRQDAEQERAQRKQIRTPIHLAATPERLLGGHVGNGSEREARPSLERLRRRQHARDAKSRILACRSSVTKMLSGLMSR